MVITKPSVRSVLIEKWLRIIKFSENRIHCTL